MTNTKTFRVIDTRTPPLAHRSSASDSCQADSETLKRKTLFSNRIDKTNSPPLEEEIGGNVPKSQHQHLPPISPPSSPTCPRKNTEDSPFPKPQPSALTALKESRVKRRISSHLERARTLNSQTPLQNEPRLTRTENEDTSSSSSSAKSSEVIEKLQDDVEEFSIKPRKDMILQELLAHQRRQEAHSAWCEEHRPTSMVESDRIWALKALVVEAERFQEERELNMLKIAIVLTAAQSLGRSCPRNFFKTTKASTVIFADMETLLTLPRSKQPLCGAVSFAQKEIQSFPLWRKIAPLQFSSSSG